MAICHCNIACRVHIVEHTTRDRIEHHYLDTRSSLSLPRCRLLCWAWWKWYLATLKQWSGQQQQPKPKPRWSVTKLGSLHSAVNAVREGSFHYIIKRVKDHLGRVLHTDNLLYQSIAPSSTWYPWGPSRVNITILNWLHNNSLFFIWNVWCIDGMSAQVLNIVLPLRWKHHLPSPKEKCRFCRKPGLFYPWFGALSWRGRWAGAG